MKQVKAHLSIKRKSNVIFYKDSTNWYLKLWDKPKFMEEIVQEFVHDEKAVEVDLEIVIKSSFQFKSTSQLGYFHAEILFKFCKYMEQQGDDRSEKAKKDDLKMHPAINFVEIEKSTLTGELYQVPRSYASASKDELADIIDRHIRLGGDFGIEFETPEAYKKRKGIKEFSDNSL